MNETDRRRPVFVYGTLRPGQPHWEAFLAAAAERVMPGRLTGVELLDCGHYPAGVERPGSAGVVGEAVWVRPGMWRATLAGLDHLEGYDPSDGDRLYDRVIRSIDTVDGPVDCWVYLAGRVLARSGRPIVPGGDWVAYRAEPPAAP